ncbi:hypothetical protein EVAR_81293_1 [Eumeta japonica]|uniref:Uncharacterized protein n=1 Tax=Eumeta variegata TaxID=151549 RepID=A0A4C1W0J9_EUMVA|nr:hypothetical protein EVAR_81293_1 [Eumeta japonica]
MSLTERPARLVLGINSAARRALGAKQLADRGATPPSIVLLLLLVLLMWCASAARGGGCHYSTTLQKTVSSKKPHAGSCVNTAIEMNARPLAPRPTTGNSFCMNQQMAGAGADGQFTTEGARVCTPDSTQRHKTFAGLDVSAGRVDGTKPYE